VKLKQKFNNTKLLVLQEQPTGVLKNDIDDAVATSYGNVLRSQQERYIHRLWRVVSQKYHHRHRHCTVQREFRIDIRFRISSIRFYEHLVATNSTVIISLSLLGFVLVLFRGLFLEDICFNLHFYCGIKRSLFCSIIL